MIVGLDAGSALTAAPSPRQVLAPESLSVPDPCIFCQIVAGEAPAFVVDEDDTTLAFLDIAGTDGHTLIVPKQHADDIWSIPASDAMAVMAMAKRVAHLLDHRLSPDGLSLTQANRAPAGQEVFHFHLHVIPRWGTYPDWELRGAQPTREALAQVLERLR